MELTFLNMFGLFGIKNSLFFQEREDTNDVGRFP